MYRMHGIHGNPVPAIPATFGLNLGRVFCQIDVHQKCAAHLERKNQHPTESDSPMYCAGILPDGCPLKNGMEDHTPQELACSMLLHAQAPQGYTHTLS